MLSWRYQKYSRTKEGSEIKLKGRVSLTLTLGNTNQSRSVDDRRLRPLGFSGFGFWVWGFCMPTMDALLRVGVDCHDVGRTKLLRTSMSKQTGI